MSDLILTIICVIFVAEAAAPVAAIGNSQFFWWILLIVTFLLPYGLISSELGTSYPGEGGLYDWTRKAYGNRMGSRVAWYYWINFPIWMASLAVMTPMLLEFIFGTTCSLAVTIIIELVFIWAVVIISCFPVADNIWIFNGVGVIKIFLALALGVFGIYTAITKGVSNEFTLSSFFPHGIEGLSYISVVLFNFLGFEVVCTFSDSMEDPNKQIPKGIIVGGIVIAAVYIFSSFGISVAVPVEEISTDSGIVEAFQAMTGKENSVFISVMAALFLITLFGNMISWASGVNNVAAYASDNGDMPKLFGKRNPNTEMPVGSSIINGVVASVIVIIAPFIPNQDLFWTFFSLNLFAFLVSYLPMFPAFLKLRRIDPDTPRPYKVKGNKTKLTVMAYLPFIEIIICLIFVVVPISFDPETLAATLPITIGAALMMAVIEVYVRCFLPSQKKSK